MKTEGQTPLLVRTPAQQADESTWGYVLRLTSCNGYPGPTALFRLAGMARVEHQGLNVNCHKLAAVLGENGSQLRPYFSSEDGTVTLMNGGVLWPSDLTVGAQRLCVQCVNERGYVPSWTELRLVDACPIHKKLLLTECPSCGKVLNWKRPSILQCSCGETFDDDACAPALEEHCALIGALVRLVEGKEFEQTAPFWQAFSPLTLSRLLGLCRGMARLHSQVFRDGSLSDCQRAARMLRDWPSNLYGIIDLIAEGEEVETTHGGTILRQLAAGGYVQMIKAVSEPSDIAVLLSVLADYVPGEGEPAKRQLTIAPSLNMNPRARIGAKPLRVAVSKPKAMRVPRGGEFGLRSAAYRLGMPVEMLKFLRKNGHFEVRRAAAWSSALSHEDIERFETKVLNLPSVAVEGATVTVRELLLRSLRGDSKGLIAVEILEGRIRVAGRVGPLFSDLVLLEDEAETVRRGLRRDTYGGTLSCSEAGALIGLNPTAIASHCRRGLIRSYKCVIGFRVYPGAAEEFNAEYVGIQEVAKAGGSGAIWAVVAAEDCGVEIFRDIERPARDVVIRRADMSKVVRQLLATRRGVKKAKGSGSMWAQRKAARKGSAN